MRLVLAMGCFDLLHVGHVRHLEQAARMGDGLVVGVTMDAGVGKAGRPIIPQNERLEIVRSLRCVFDAALFMDSIAALKHFKPNVFCKGHDYIQKGLLDAEIEYCRINGITVAITDENPQTTSNIIERIKCAS